MKKLVLIVVSIVIGIMVCKKNDDIIIPSDAIRIRIIANGNDTKDLLQKKKIKEEIKKDLYNLVKDSNNSFEASEKISNNLDKLDTIISKITKDYKIDYGENYFPNKTYKGVIYPAGTYKSIVITLGDGQGDNWWCVLYPPLCMIDENRTTKDVEYKSMVGEILGFYN